MKAKAKINVGLNIVRKRADGYHDLETVFVPIDLADELIFNKIEGNDIELIESGEFILDCPKEKNLICKAYYALKADFPQVGGLRVELQKHIPFGAGLGGGSSDAAKTLLAVNELFSLNLTRDDLLPYASRLGADCAFFLYDCPCYAEGIGDKLTPITLHSLSKGEASCDNTPLNKLWHLVLVKPPVSVSTKEAYAGVSPKQPQVNLRESIQLPVAQWRGKISNDFEQSVFAQYPVIQTVRDELYRMGAIYASMTGSGASVFALFHANAENLNNLQKHFPDCFVWQQ